MTNRSQSKRLKLFQLLLVGAFVALAGWLAYLQGIRHEDLARRAEANTRQKRFLEPRRGDILDIKKHLLATSIIVKTVCANPQLLVNHEAPVARAIAPLLQMDERDVLQRLQMRYRRAETGRTITNRWVVLKKKVPPETWQRIYHTMTNLTFGVNERSLPRTQQAFYRNLRQSAIFTDPMDDQLRLYPNQALAAHVLGYIGETEGGDRFTTITGVDGIECTFNKQLRGVRGWRITEMDPRKQELVDLREQNVEPHDGLNVILTIDSAIQHTVEEALAEAMTQHSPTSASCVVVRPSTGEILAMATLPNFDPNNLSAADLAARRTRNRLVSDMNEPGSTFKVVPISGALNDKVVDLNETFFCENGHWQYMGRTLGDHGSHGNLTVEGIITESSNIGAAKVALKLGAPGLFRYIGDFGFGQKTGLLLLGEAPGLVTNRTRWDKLAITRIPMGHGIAVTPIQMVMAVSAIANHGLLMRPMLVDRLEDNQGRVVTKQPPQSVRQVITEATARQMVQALKTVVAAPRGTGKKARLEHYTVAGKTGTAEKVEGGSYSKTRHFSSFVGFLPADAPELCIGVFLDEPRNGHMGGDAVAPVFKQIAEKAASYLSIKPDLDADFGQPETPANSRAQQTLRAAPALSGAAAHE